MALDSVLRTHQRPAKSEAQGRLLLADRLALRPTEAAAVIGISPAAFRRIAPEIPCIRRGKLKLYRPATLDAWLTRNERSDETTAEAIADGMLSGLD